MAEKLEMMSSNIIQENIDYIASKFPNALKEVMENGKLVKKIDFDILKQELSTILIDDRQERYQMTWPDKKKSILLANSRINATLRPIKEKSVDFDNTKNLYIEGDNLDVLKLLRETYLGKVDVIYIDPPYNTGSDLLYNDEFSQDFDDYLLNSGQFDSKGNRMIQNLESNGKFHTTWLNMIYPRLKVARDFLSDDGTIFISIDDHEVHNLRKVCDEIFGVDKFVTSIPRITKQQRAGQEKYMDISHDYILVYSKSDDFKHIIKRNLDEKNILKDKNGYYIAGDTKAILAARSQGYSKGGDYDFEYNGKLYKPVDSNGIRNRWLWTKPRMEAAAKLGILVETQNTLRMQLYLDKRFDDLTNTMVDKDPNLIFHTSDFMVNGKYTNSSGFSDLQKVFGKETPSNMYPKPVELIKDLISLVNNKKAIVMDFFSGSGTTAESVFKLNIEDEGNRKFILIQLPEKYDFASSTFTSKTICDLGEERIRRAGKIIKESSGVSAQKLDIGFRVLKLDSSNMNDVYYNPNLLNQGMLEQLVGNVKEDRTALDLLFQVMLELGIELSAKIEEKELNGKTYFVVNENDIVACFDNGIDDDLTKELAKIKPIYAVFKDSSFTTDSANINCEQIFKSISPSTTIKVI